MSFHTEKEESSNGLNQAGKSLGKGVKKSVAVVGSVLDDFKEFLNRGNVVDLAVGVVMGAAFTTVVNSMVADLFTPVIGLAVDSSLQNAFLLLACPRNPTTGKRGIPGTDCRLRDWSTVAQATAAGAVTWNWGAFVQSVINFIIISVIVFFIVKVYAAAFRRKPKPKTKDCEFCLNAIPIKAVRCPNCTTHLTQI
ncbi:large-conductance mechanosensitive channel [Globomyces pollinis-pini]|nr:large-conductance mechanosensitive channel [Globomyces pollinis-pini]